MQTPILATVLTLSALGAAGAATAQPAYYPPGVVVQGAPPPYPHRVAPPRPRPGQAWVPGRWEWRHGRQVWAGGHWVPVRMGPQRGGRDRDGDGVPDRHDRRPNDPRWR